MQQWEADGQDEKFNDMFSKEWGKQWEQEETEKSQVIPFEPKNQYMDIDNNLQTAKQLVEVRVTL